MKSQFVLVLPSSSSPSLHGCSKNVICCQIRRDPRILSSVNIQPISQTKSEFFGQGSSRFQGTPAVIKYGLGEDATRFEVLASEGSLTEQSVRKKLQSQDPLEKAQGIRECRQLDSKVAAEYLLEACEAKDIAVRYQALNMLAGMGPQDAPAKAAEVLSAILQDDPEPTVQAVAADAIAGLGLNVCLPLLREKLQTSVEWITRLSVVAALGAMQDTGSFDLLVTALEASPDADSNTHMVQITAVAALGELGDKRAIAALQPFVDHPDPLLQMQARQAIQVLLET